MRKYLRILSIPIRGLLDLALLLPLFLLCLISRCVQRRIDIGIGPEPIIGHKYHKKALERYGYAAQTYVNSVYFLSEEFDVRVDKVLGKWGFLLLPYLLFGMVIFRYKGIYIYFNGGPLFPTVFLWRVEPFLYKMAGVKVVVMPYGGDVQELSRSRNLSYKAAMSKDYPGFRFKRKRIEKRIDLWTKYANHVISGCDWVEYMYHWDTLVLAHFTIDEDRWKPTSSLPTSRNQSSPLRVFHAPNHRHIKGTEYLISAIEDLKKAGYEIELVILERVPNEKVKEMISTVDIVADQLIIGWYGMFAVEAMAMGKPVLCHIREDFEDLFIQEGLLEPGELPIIRCSPQTVKETLVQLIEDRDRLVSLGERSRDFVLKHHSTEAMGKVFDRINRSMGIVPSMPCSSR
jgi:glycosyltransferase involved in cell wall biosynthesis